MSENILDNTLVVECIQESAMRMLHREERAKMTVDEKIEGLENKITDLLSEVKQLRQENQKSLKPDKQKSPCE
ncbi:MAG: hypothetical protein LBJ00_10865 [Planctomycetaceae bacterium]|jgi:prefoldin subunit 5|nr:hypothetical protein [Planctomycetaceae bacterium]